MKKTFVFMAAILSVLFMAGYAYADGLCVNAPKANLRIGPGTNHEIGWQVFKYMPLEKVGVSKSGDWYAVKDVDSDVMWIHKNLVTSNFRCAVVNAREVNVRTGPGTNHPRSQMGPAKKYYSYRVLETRDSWVRVRDEWGSIGWIHQNFLWIR
jgi:SH3-like domain-containing protein